MPSKWYAFKNTDQSNEVEVSLYDEIGFYGVGAKEFIEELKTHSGKHLHLRINSPGGEIIEGTAIYNALKRHKGGVTVHIDGLAASMASVISMAGDPVFMASNALIMVHNPWTIAAGESEDLRKQADLLDTMKSNLVGAYTRKSGLEEEEVRKMMDEETWMDAREALAKGFIDAIEDATPVAASARDLRSRFDNFAQAMSKKLPKATEVAPEAAPVAEIVDEKPQAEAVVAEVATVEILPEVPAVEEAQAEEAKAEAAPAEEVAPEAPAAEEPEIASPVAKADHEFAAALLKVSAERDTFRAQLDQAKAGEVAAKAEAAELREQMAAKDALHNALKRSLGIAAAVEVPVTPVGEPINLIEQLNKLSGAERTEFFRKHRAEILKQTNK
jgi:ATP-dependent Clp protease protease subunit